MLFRSQVRFLLRVCNCSASSIMRFVCSFSFRVSVVEELRCVVVAAELLVLPPSQMAGHSWGILPTELLIVPLPSTVGGILVSYLTDWASSSSTFLHQVRDGACNAFLGYGTLWSHLPACMKKLLASAYVFVRTSSNPNFFTSMLWGVLHLLNALTVISQCVSSKPTQPYVKQNVVLTLVFSTINVPDQILLRW
jgi:hypothetical protein